MTICIFSLRVLLGVIFLDTGSSKVLHIRQFQKGIRAYQLIPPTWDRFIPLLSILSFSFAIIELAIGVTLLSNFLVHLLSLLAIILLLLFSVAIVVNLIRGHKNLLCNCGGILGRHYISWGLIARNFLFCGGFAFLVVFPSDNYNLLKLCSAIWSFHIPIEALIYTVLEALIYTVLPILLAIVGISFVVALLFFARGYSRAE